jgi:hypothetical protein
MTPEENERELKRLLQDDPADERRFDHRVEWLIAIAMLALFLTGCYAATHIDQIEGATQWLLKFSHWPSSSR